MYLCILDAGGQTVLHQAVEADHEETFHSRRRALTPVYGEFEKSF
jgi:hypothetical protein